MILIKNDVLFCVGPLQGSIMVECSSPFLPDFVIEDPKGTS